MNRRTFFATVIGGAVATQVAGAAPTPRSLAEAVADVNAQLRDAGLMIDPRCRETIRDLQAIHLYFDPVVTRNGHALGRATMTRRLPNLTSALQSSSPRVLPPPPRPMPQIRTPPEHRDRRVHDARSHETVAEDRTTHDRAP